MELEVKVEQVFECPARDCADRALANVCEYCVQQLAGKRCSYASRAVCPSHVLSIDQTETIEERSTTHMQGQPSRR
jgi:hypothetical protein